MRSEIKINYDDLYKIDNELEDLTTKIKKLKREKHKLLGNQKGLKVLNETEIEKFKINKKMISTEDDDEDDENYSQFGTNPHTGIRVIFKPIKNQESGKKSENFEIITGSKYNFTQIGGYETVKEELMQCADILVNYDKYSKYNVRVPKGLVLEGPPGNGKTLLAKCFAGQINVSFIPVSGAQFQEKFVGVGSSRVRELFSLANDNKPCIIFIDEIDAIGRKRSSDEVGQNSERDSTLNELLVSLDGFQSSDGIFIMGATNRADLLDNALTRPGRIDKSIYIGVPDSKTRKLILDIHIRGKPYGNTVTLEELNDITQGFSGAQIENLLNEAMLLTLRNNKEQMEKPDIDFIMDRILVGSQSTENLFSEKMLYQIAIHEMGHAIVGVLCKEYNKLVKVTINVWSPTSPGYTLFEIKENELLINKQHLVCHLAVLLAGRVAEEEFFNEAITTGASKDLEEVKNLAYKMIIDYGMGSKLFYPVSSDKSKEMIDKEVNDLVDKAYNKAKLIVANSKSLLDECAKILVTEQMLTADFITQKISKRYPHLHVNNNYE
jgi:cell division protease FtsH